MRVKRIVLEHEADASFLRGEVRDFLIAEPDFARGGGLKAGDHIKGRGFAAAGGAEQTDELTVGNNEAHVFDGNCVANAFFSVPGEDFR